METKSIAWQTGSGNITLTYTGQGDGPITVLSDVNDIGSVRSQVVTIETTKGSPVITKNLTISQAACPFPVGDVKNYAYTGSYQEVELPAGKYKLQCWGAQGGSNAAASSYGITAKAGGKGGYSEGIITLSQKTTVRVYVGGQGSSSAGGFNGGGSTTGYSSYNSGNEQGVSRMGGGGGATDIRLSDGALLSRMIVAGGGSGGAMCYQAITTTTPTETLIHSVAIGYTGQQLLGKYLYGSLTDDYWSLDGGTNLVDLVNGKTYKINSSGGGEIHVVQRSSSNGWLADTVCNSGEQFTFSKNSSTVYIRIACLCSTSELSSVTLTVYEIGSSSSTTTNTSSQVGYVGGGTTGGGYSNTYKGRQNAAGSNGSFGNGAAMSIYSYRYCSGAGGGGWYGGGGAYSDSSIAYCKYSGGGSGFVNTAASASNRPSGYTGLQLDSGSTTAGSSSFPAPSGGNETGHSGNGYARITRLQN